MGPKLATKSAVEELGLYPRFKPKHVSSARSRNVAIGATYPRKPGRKATETNPKANKQNAIETSPNTVA